MQKNTKTLPLAPAQTTKRTASKVLLVFLLVLFLLPSVLSAGDCNAPMNNLPCNLTTSRNLPQGLVLSCPTIYDCIIINTSNIQVNFTDLVLYYNGSSGYAAVRVGLPGGIKAHNVTLNFDKAHFIGNGTGTAIDSNANGDGVKAYNFVNLTINDGIFENFDYGLRISANSLYEQTLLINRTVANNNWLAFYVGGINNTILDNIQGINSRWSHGLYADALTLPTYNLEVKNSLFANNSGSGAKNNGQTGKNQYYNISFHNNILYGNGCPRLLSAYDSEVAANMTFYNNQIFNNKQGLEIHNVVNNNDNHVEAFNNTFYGNNKCGTFFDVIFWENASYNYVHDNNFPVEVPVFLVQNGSYNDRNYVYQNNTYFLTLKVGFPSGYSIIGFNYSGVKNFSVTNSTVTLSTGTTFTVQAGQSVTIDNPNISQCEMNLSLGLNCFSQNSLVTLSGHKNYYVNSSINTYLGALMLGSNSLLDCQGSGLIGNTTTYGILINGSNVTVQNCNLSNYRINIYTDGNINARLDNVSIINNTFDNMFEGVYFRYANNVTVTNNKVIGCDNSVGSASLYFILTNGLNILNNNITTDSTCEKGIQTAFSSRWVTIKGNWVENIDRGIYSSETRDLFIFNNTVKNATRNLDWYEVGIMLHDISDSSPNCSNVLIQNNTIIKAGAAGILVHHCYNATLDGNNISMVTYAEKNLYDETDNAGQPNCGIFVTERWKGQVGNGQESKSVNYANSSFMSSNYITLSNNIFDSSVQCYLYAQGVRNLTYDFLNYWSWRFQFPVEYQDETEIFVPNTVNTLITWRHDTWPGWDTNYLWYSTPTTYPAGYQRYRYIYSKDQLIFQAFNISYGGNFTIFNATGNVSIYNDTNASVIGNNINTLIFPLFQNQTIRISKSSASGGCDYPYIGISIRVNTTFCNITVTNLINGTGGGAINIQASNVYLHGNGISIWGNKTGTAIRWTSVNDIHIDGFNIYNYANGIRGDTSSGINVSNNYIFNVTDASVTCLFNTANCYVGYNTIEVDNQFYDYTTANAASTLLNTQSNGIKIFGTINYTVEYNTIRKTNRGIYTQGGIQKNGIIQYNILNGVKFRSIDVSDYSNNTKVFQNTISNTDCGIHVLNSTYTNLSGNILNNVTTNFDDYDVGIYVRKYSSNTTIFNNSIEYGRIGVLVQQANDTEIISNVFNQVSLANKLSYCYGRLNWGCDWYDGTQAIFVAQIEKNTLDGSEAPEKNYNYNDAVVNWTSYGVIIQNNIYNSNVQVFLKTQNAQGIVHDLSNFWYSKSRFPEYLFGIEEYYISNNYNTLSAVPVNVSSQLNLSMLKAWGTKKGFTNEASYFIGWYSISKSMQYYKNVNLTTTYNLSLYNLTYLYPYNDVFNGTNPQPQCSDVNDCNVSMGARNRTLVFQYATNTEPRYTRIAATIDTITVINKKTDYLAYNCTGSGYVVINGLTSFFGGKSYRVYHNGAYVESSNSDTYINDGTCSSWEFTRLENIYEADVALEKDSSAMSNLIKVLGLIAGIYAAYFIINALLKREFDFEEFKWITFTIIIIGIAFAILLMVISEF